MAAQPIDRHDESEPPTEPQSFRPVANDESGEIRISGVLNAYAAAAKAAAPVELVERISRALRGHGRVCDITVADGDSLEAAFTAIAKDCDCLIVAGGDGSILTAAKAAITAEKPLMVIPMGTMNVFAKSLGIPDGDAAATALVNGDVKKLDIGIVNGQMFLNCVAIGPFADLTRAREQLRGSSELSQWASILAESWKTVFEPQPYRYHIKRPGTRWRNALALIVSNNPFSGDPFTFFHRDSLATGRLGCYVVRHRSFARTLLHLALTYMGFESRDPALSVGESERLEVELDQSTIEGLVDGEVMTLKSPLRFEIRRQALQVVVPRQ